MAPRWRQIQMKEQINDMYTQLKSAIRQGKARIMRMVFNKSREVVCILSLLPLSVGNVNHTPKDIFYSNCFLKDKRAKLCTHLISSFTACQKYHKWYVCQYPSQIFPVHYLSTMPPFSDQHFQEL